MALRFYGSGYNWVDIARENGLKGPEKILAGQELRIPKAEVRQPVVQATETAKGGLLAAEPIGGTEYTVVKGDSLWKIAVRAYQDGFKWSQIAKANKLANPNLIHPGNVLKLVR
ncbi:LysM peptidoglycan-binding domain-containing protein [Candidatus Shapirobacteria bacterium]|nr:LysM peptidoglycan-binding domain-containing protein [Candidatus Shapirobacteria bacterium]